MPTACLRVGIFASGDPQFSGGGAPPPSTPRWGWGDAPPQQRPRVCVLSRATTVSLLLRSGVEPNPGPAETKTTERLRAFTQAEVSALTGPEEAMAARVRQGRIPGAEMARLKGGDDKAVRLYQTVIRMRLFVDAQAEGGAAAAPPPGSSAPKASTKPWGGNTTTILFPNAIRKIQDEKLKKLCTRVSKGGKPTTEELEVLSPDQRAAVQMAARGAQVIADSAAKEVVATTEHLSASLAEETLLNPHGESAKLAPQVDECISKWRNAKSVEEASIEGARKYFATRDSSREVQAEMLRLLRSLAKQATDAVRADREKREAEARKKAADESPEDLAQRLHNPPASTRHGWPANDPRVVEVAQNLYAAEVAEGKVKDAIIAKLQAENARMSSDLDTARKAATEKLAAATKPAVAEKPADLRQAEADKAALQARLDSVSKLLTTVQENHQEADKQRAAQTKAAVESALQESKEEALREAEQAAERKWKAEVITATATVPPAALAAQREMEDALTAAQAENKALKAELEKATAAQLAAQIASKPKAGKAAAEDQLLDLTIALHQAQQERDNFKKKFTSVANCAKDKAKRTEAREAQVRVAEITAAHASGAAQIATEAATERIDIDRAGSAELCRLVSAAQAAAKISLATSDALAAREQAMAAQLQANAAELNNRDAALVEARTTHAAQLAAALAERDAAYTAHRLATEKAIRSKDDTIAASAQQLEAARLAHSEETARLQQAVATASTLAGSAAQSALTEELSKASAALERMTEEARSEHDRHAAVEAALRAEKYTAEAALAEAKQQILAALQGNVTAHEAYNAQLATSAAAHAAEKQHMESTLAAFQEAQQATALAHKTELDAVIETSRLKQLELDRWEKAARIRQEEAERARATPPPQPSYLPEETQPPLGELPTAPATAEVTVQPEPASPARLQGTELVDLTSPLPSQPTLSSRLSDTRADSCTVAKVAVNEVDKRVTLQNRERSPAATGSSNAGDLPVKVGDKRTRTTAPAPAEAHMEIRGLSNYKNDCFLIAIITLLSRLPINWSRAADANPNPQRRKACILFGEAVSWSRGINTRPKDTSFRSLHLMKELRRTLHACGVVNTLDEQEDITMTIEKFLPALLPHLTTDVPKDASQDRATRPHPDEIADMYEKGKFGGLQIISWNCACGDVGHRIIATPRLTVVPDESCDLSIAALYGNTSTGPNERGACERCGTRGQSSGSTTFERAHEFLFVSISTVLNTKTPIQITCPTDGLVLLGDSLYKVVGWAQFHPGRYTDDEAMDGRSEYAHAESGHYTAFTQDHEQRWVEVNNAEARKRQDHTKYPGVCFLLRFFRKADGPSQEAPRFVDAATAEAAQQVRRPGGSSSAAPRPPAAHEPPTTTEPDLPPASHGRGGGANLASCGDVEVNPGPPPPPGGSSPSADDDHTLLLGPPTEPVFNAHSVAEDNLAPLALGGDFISFNGNEELDEAARDNDATPRRRITFMDDDDDAGNDQDEGTPRPATQPPTPRPKPAPKSARAAGTKDESAKARKPKKLANFMARDPQWEFAVNYIRKMEGEYPNVEFTEMRSQRELAEAKKHRDAYMEKYKGDLVICRRNTTSWVTPLEIHGELLYNFKLLRLIDAHYTYCTDLIPEGHMKAICRCSTRVEVNNDPDAPLMKGRHRDECLLSSGDPTKGTPTNYRSYQAARDHVRATKISEFKPPAGWDAHRLINACVSPLRFIPVIARPLVAAAADIAFSAPHNKRWWLIIAFAKIVLTRRAHAARQDLDIMRRARAFSSLELESLLLELQIESEKTKRLRRAPKPTEFEASKDAPRHTPFSLFDECIAEVKKGQKAAQHVREGEASRGMSSMSPSPLAPATPEVMEELNAKHPPAGDTGITSQQMEALLKADWPAGLGADEVIRCLRSFPPGSAAGPTGMRPAVLLSLMTCPGSPLKNSVPGTVYALMTGDVPEEMRPIFYGARLIPLVKKDKALRPIACSEALRRVAAKVYASRLSEKFRDKLVQSGQIGVAVSSGLESLVAFTRRSGTGLGDDEVIVKIDCCNAFNSVHRSAIAEAVLKHMPELSMYVAGAYGKESLLFCEGGTVVSAMGVQQGDPLGPVLFSLAALVCSELPAEMRAKLRGSGWYLDDGLLAGPADAVYAALKYISEQGEKIGLKLNVKKTEVLGNNPAVWAPYLEEFPGWRPLKDLEMLGLPCSPDPAGVEEYTAKFLERVRSRTEAVKQVIEVDPHAGYLLLRMCTGFSASNHLARARGNLGVYDEIDEMIITAMDACCPLTQRAADIARLPFRLGGLGLRSTATHAAAAFVAAYLETQALMPLFSSPDRPEALALPEDDLLQPALDDLPVYLREEVENHRPPKGTFPKAFSKLKLQRKFGKLIDDKTAEHLHFDSEELGRVVSCSQRGASMYLVGPVSHDDRIHELFLSADEFITSIRLRLGMQVSPKPHKLLLKQRTSAAESAVSDPPVQRCNLCNKSHTLDEYGHRARSCMNGGYRTRAHNKLRDTTIRVLNDCCITASPEPPDIFCVADKRHPDFATYLGGKVQCVDVAITHPNDPEDFTAQMDKPGGAATRYGLTKHVKYDGILKGSQEVVAFVCDSYGALGDEALAFVQRLISPFALRLGVSKSVASRIIFGRITTCVIRSMARIVAMASGLM